MPICTKCKLQKSEIDFNYNACKKRLEYHCKKCHSEYLKKHYKENKEYYKTKAVKRRSEITEWFKQYKNKLKCIECGENHPACLDFHHRDPKVKEITLSQAIRNSWSVQRIMEEIEKCDILCCKCHRILHYEEKLSLECGGSTQVYET